MVAFAVTAKMFPENVALTTAIVETSLNCAIATSPYIGAELYEVQSGSRICDLRTLVLILLELLIM